MTYRKIATRAIEIKTVGFIWSIPNYSSFNEATVAQTYGNESAVGINSFRHPITWFVRFKMFIKLRTNLICIFTFFLSHSDYNRKFFSGQFTTYAEFRLLLRFANGSTFLKNSIYFISSLETKKRKWERKRDGVFLREKKKDLIYAWLSNFSPHKFTFLFIFTLGRTRQGVKNWTAYLYLRLHTFKYFPTRRTFH